MANNFAEALFGARDNARDRIRQQEIDAQANQMRQFQMQEAQTKSRGSQQEALYWLAKGYKDYLSQNPQGGQQYYERFLAPSLRGLRLGDPGPYNEPEAISLADQVLSAYGGQQTGSSVQSTYVDNESNRVAVMRDGTRQILGKNAPATQILEGEGGFYGVNKNTEDLKATPVGLGVSTANPITGTNFGIAETNDYVQSILSRAGNIDPNSTPEQQAEALLPYLIQQESGGDPNAVSPKGAQGLTQVMPATGQDPGFGVQPLRDNTTQENVRFGRDYLTAMLRRYPGRVDLALAAYNAGPGVADRFATPTAQAGPQQLRPAPKAATVPAGYSVNPDGTMAAIPGGPADVARQAREDAAAARKAAEDVKAQQRAQEANQRKMASDEAASGLISAIDKLTASPGFPDLGTTWGDAQIATPFVRNDAKDAQAQLKNVAGQVALAALARLKSLSSTGATGFGSLTKPELDLVQNSIATLQSEDISNAELRRSLKIIRDAMEKVSNWQPPANETAAAPGGWKIERVD